jgi:hypothetical protein
MAEDAKSPDKGGQLDNGATNGEAPPTQQIDAEESTMLDVHPPHAAPHSWKDFFIQIATITIGLLIAIGLEQSVEYVHDLYQLQAARRELSVEINDNRRIAKRNTEALHTIEVGLDNDMKSLRASQSQHAAPGAKLDYDWTNYVPEDGAWQTVKQNGTLELMPQAELRHYIYVYFVISKFEDEMSMQVEQLEKAAAIVRRAPDGNLSPRDIDELVTATSDAQATSATLAKLLQFEISGLSRIK